MTKRKKPSRVKNAIAKDLRTPKYKKRVVQDKKKKSKNPRADKNKAGGKLAQGEG